jgi:hypothetical protein
VSRLRGAFVYFELLIATAAGGADLRAEAEQGLRVWAPLANRLGVWSLKAELEDLCFLVSLFCGHWSCHLLTLCLSGQSSFRNVLAIWGCGLGWLSVDADLGVIVAALALQILPDQVLRAFQSAQAPDR